MSDETWTPDQPLRADATPSEIEARAGHLTVAHLHVYLDEALAMARGELAVAEVRREMTERLAAVEAERDEARQTLANVQNMLMDSTEDVLASEGKRDRLRIALKLTHAELFRAWHFQGYRIGGPLSEPSAASALALAKQALVDTT